MNGLPQSFTPPCLRSLFAMDKESLGKTLHHCLLAVGRGHGADPPAAPAPQAAPSALYLADRFPPKEEVLVHNTCKPDTTLAPETPEWRWLGDVTLKYGFRREMTLWMKKQRKKDKDGVQSYPWEKKCLSAGEVSEWKVLPVGLSSDPHRHMSLNGTRSGCPVHNMGHCRAWCCQKCVLVWRGFRVTGRWSQRRTWPTLLLQGSGVVATRLARQN